MGVEEKKKERVYLREGACEPTKKNKKLKIEEGNRSKPHRMSLRKCPENVPPQSPKKRIRKEWGPWNKKHSVIESPKNNGRRVEALS